MRVNYIKRLETTWWYGDEMRGENNIRSAVVPVYYVREEDYKILESQGRTWQQIFCSVINMDYGAYACDVLEAAEDGCEEAIEIHNKNREKARSLIEEEVVFECERELQEKENVPVGYVKYDIPSQKVYIVKQT